MYNCKCKNYMVRGIVNHKYQKIMSCVALVKFNILSINKYIMQCSFLFLFLIFQIPVHIFHERKELRCKNKTKTTHSSFQITYNLLSLLI